MVWVYLVTSCWTACEYLGCADICSASSIGNVEGQFVGFDSIDPGPYPVDVCATLR